MFNGFTETLPAACYAVHAYGYIYHVSCSLPLSSDSLFALLPFRSNAVHPVPFPIPVPIPILFKSQRQLLVIGFTVK